MRYEKTSPIVESMGPEVHTIFLRVNGTMFEQLEVKGDIKKARFELKKIREENPGNQYMLVSEDRPDLAPNVPLKKFQPAGWKL